MNFLALPVHPHLLRLVRNDQHLAELFGKAHGDSGDGFRRHGIGEHFDRGLVAVRRRIHHRLHHLPLEERLRLPRFRPDRGG